jgi:murein DD-endopeptidase MepM/ murein hydrolase activator NlpD
MMCLDAVILAVLASTQTVAAESPVVARGRQLTQWFFAGELDSVRAGFDAQMSRAFSPQQMQTFLAQLREQLGSEKRVVDEREGVRDGKRIYSRLCEYEKAPILFEVQWTFDAEDRVAGFFIRPPTSAFPSPHLDYQTKTPLQLPFHGSWLVVWGGRTVGLNYHAAAPDQRFACDFLVRRDNSTHAGDGADNTQFYAFGQEVLAPAAGTVVAAVDGIADNVPGRTNSDQPLGNHVILDHGNGEFSFLAHLQQGSIQVKPKQKVASGAVLGRCGNSGRATEPQLHYHLQATGEPFRGEGLPAFFVGYQADGKLVERGEPLQGQTVSP